MHRLYLATTRFSLGIGLAFVTLITAFAVGGQIVYALGSPTIVISQVRTGTTASAMSEFIEIYNNSSEPVDISNWCLYYASASTAAVGSKIACFVPSTPTTHLMLLPYSFALAISTQYAVTTPTLSGDIAFSATLSGTAGHVRLLDGASNEIDKLGYGSLTSTGAISPETKAVSAPTFDLVLLRASVNNLKSDTDNNNADFYITSHTTGNRYGSLYEVVDICSNLDGIQQVLPANFALNASGNCYDATVDACSNIEGIQPVIPSDHAVDISGNCLPDVCVNIIGTQIVMPDGYYLSNTGQCYRSMLPIYVTELLPNAEGIDDGREFIELYNPNDTEISLEYYQLSVGASGNSTVSFTYSDRIAPRSYFVIYNDTRSFTMNNTNGLVTVRSVDGVIIDQSLAYLDPGEGESWAKFDEGWMYTNTPTPGALNLVMQLGEAQLPDAAVDVSAPILKPCAANQERNLETNRCRLISAASTTARLTPCKDGQYRSEETNRCRAIGSTESTVAACKDGQQRNPDTNRCRNVASSKIPEADYEVLGASSQKGPNYLLIGIIVVLVAALGYAIWEWRYEMGKLWHRALLFVRRTK